MNFVVSFENTTTLILMKNKQAKVFFLRRFLSVFYTVNILQKMGAMCCKAILGKFVTLLSFYFFSDKNL